LSARNASRSASTVTWCSSAANACLLLCLAACRVRFNPWDTRSRR
jgi:hypothetical protein